MTCLALLIALTFCEPAEQYLVREYVDMSVGLYCREYIFEGVELIESYQLASTDLKDDRIETEPHPLMVSINRKPYRVACEGEVCSLEVY